MIPGGFSAYRGELTFGDPVMDVITVIVYGLADTMAGAFFNRIKTLSSIYSI